MSKDELLSLKSKNKMDLSDKILLVESKLTESNTVGKKKIGLWNDSNIKINNKINQMKGVSEISTIDDLNDKESKLLEYIEKESNIRSKKNVYDNETQKINQLMKAIRNVEASNKDKSI